MKRWTGGVVGKLSFLGLESYGVAAFLEASPVGNVTVRVRGSPREEWEAGGQRALTPSPPSQALAQILEVWGWYFNGACPCLETSPPHGKGSPTSLGIRISWGALNNIDCWVPPEIYHSEYCWVGPWNLYVF